MIELKPAINEVKLTLKSISSPINLGTVVEPVSGGSVPTDVRQAIYTLLDNAAYATTGLEDEIAIVQAWAQEVTALSLEPTSLELSNDTPQTIVATVVPSGSTVIWSSSDESVATVVGGVVTGVGNGSCVITATAGGKTANCAVTVSGFAVLESITAVYSQEIAVYQTDSLDILKSGLVVTATYSDTTTADVTTYELSGTLTVGTSTITVTYQGKQDTFSVTVTELNLFGEKYVADTSMYFSSDKMVYYKNSGTDNRLSYLLNGTGTHAIPRANTTQTNQTIYPIPIPATAKKLVGIMPKESIATMYYVVKWANSQWTRQVGNQTIYGRSEFDVSGINDGSLYVAFVFRNTNNDNAINSEDRTNWKIGWTV